MSEHPVIYLAPSDDPEREWCQDDVWENSVRYNLGTDFDRVTAERDAAMAQESTLARDAANWKRKAGESAEREHELQQRLTAADERVSVLEELLQMFIDNSGDKDVVELCEHALKPAKMLPADHKCIECESEYCHGVCVERGDNDDRLIG